MPGSDKCELYDQQHGRGNWAPDPDDDKKPEISNDAELRDAGMLQEWQLRNNGPGSPTSKNKNSCFVATAVYGDINAPQVQVLRDFRDNVLMETGVGRKVVDLYYSGVGEKIADFIRTQVPSVIPLARKGLDRLVQYHQTHR